MYCSKCGANVTDGAAFCSACGQPTSPVTPVGSAPAHPAAISPAIGLPPAGLPAPYAPPLIAPLPPSPYAGFWLRVVAHLIDDVILGIGIGILVLIGVAIIGVGSLRPMFEAGNGENPELPAVGNIHAHLCGLGGVYARVDLQRSDGKFPASRDAGENGARLNRHRPARAADQLSPTPAAGISQK